MSAFKPVVAEFTPKGSKFLNEEQLYWKQYALPVTVKDSALIQHVDVSCDEPFPFAISSSNRVQIYNPISRDVTCRLTKFKLNAFGAVFRGDGRLLAAGCDEGTIRLFDVRNRALLRQFAGHTRPTRKVVFGPQHQQLVSFSDDTTVVVWDIPQQRPIQSLSHHKDYVRCGKVVAGSTSLLLTASYDHTAALVDLRTSETALVVDHGAPIEAVEVLPSGTIFFTAGGNLIKVWDIASGRKLLQLCQHHKAVTCLCISSCGGKLLSGSLDRLVKVYSVVNYEMMHALTIPSPILCMALSRDSSVFVVGSETGLVTIYRRKEARINKSGVPSAQTDGSENAVKPVRRAIYVPEADDIVLSTKRVGQAGKMQNQLRRFEFTSALKTALAQASQCKKPEVFLAICDEVARRRMLVQAIEKLDERQQNAILDLIIKYITLPRYENGFLDLVEVMLRALQKRREWDDTLWLKLDHLSHIVDTLHSTHNECQELIAMIETISVKQHNHIQPQPLEPIMLEPV